MENEGHIQNYGGERDVNESGRATIAENVGVWMKLQNVYEGMATTGN